MSITEVKTKGYPDMDKIFGDMTRQMRKLQESIKMTKGALNTSDLREGEIVFSTVDKNSEAPGSPAIDEGRLYFKMSGVLYQLTGTKVGG